MASVSKRARDLRHHQTDAERKLWFCLRDRRLGGLKFRRQMPLDRFVVDFCCEDTRLVIEVDGGQHNENEQDAARTKSLEAMGCLVLRFWNNDVLTNIDGVLETAAPQNNTVLNPLTLTLSPTGRGNPSESAANVSE